MAGRKDQGLADRVSACITSGFSSVKLRVLFRINSVFPSFVKDRLSYFQNSSVIYTYKCQCDAEYIGRTSVRLEARVSQHVLANIRSGDLSLCSRMTQSAYDSAINRPTSA